MLLDKSVRLISRKDSPSEKAQADRRARWSSSFLFPEPQPTPGKDAQGTCSRIRFRWAISLGWWSRVSAAGIQSEPEWM